LLQPHYRKLRLENKNSATGSSLTSQQEGSNKSLMDYAFSKEAGSVSQILRRIPWNDKCAECNAPRVHHNFGVHMSKVHFFRQMQTIYFSSVFIM
jgi:Arf-GAP/coiled-coil/ANK repeat/PH domain-containing protein